jgi:hypothetical protein
MLEIAKMKLKFKSGEIEVSLDELVQLREELDKILSPIEKKSFKKIVKELEEKIEEVKNRPLPPAPYIPYTPVGPYTWPGTNPNIPWDQPIIYCGDDLGRPATVALSPQDVPHNG